MLCTKCGKREATVYISQTVNGIKNEIRLCPECSDKQNGYNMLNISADSLFSGFFGNNAFGTTTRVAQKECPACGMTGRELAKGGRAGCAKCYEVFDEELGKMISGIHGGARHKGSAPEKQAKNVERQKKISDLKKEQQIAISEQNYERAAELRDMIRKLESGEDD